MPAPQSGAKRRSVMVTYSVEGQGIKTCPASLTEGYSTEEDLPRIIGIWRGTDPSTITVTKVEDL